ncbi:cellulose synthase complex periplasmic endoglucanase BcsZ [Oceanisphaera sp.]|uniref:cellulose synthase complex periplasmic endoglucanase BcsZ n=1 Tax=Oceanisphaera sp. TaxID=1929979 RepID=UPI003A95A7E7
MPSAAGVCQAVNNQRKQPFAAALLKHWVLGVGLLAVGLWPGQALAQCDWPAWQHFKQAYISEQGRVIDPADERQITTSEGQSYGMFFALVADDQAAFERLLQWTQDHLAKGDLTARLPAWLWGKNAQQQWTVLDSNSAADSDLWLAYDLLEAGRLWKNRRYQVLGTLLLQRIAREEVVDIPGLGVMLLPGKQGFVKEESWKLNPSYLPPQLLARFASLTGPWQEMQQSYRRLLVGAAPLGLVPDWIVWHASLGWQPDTQTGSNGSYDAIRSYLWLGMLAADALHREALLAHLQPMADLTAKQGWVPEQVNALTGESTGVGPVGFSAALLPFLQGTATASLLRQRLVNAELDSQAYYNTVLRLFGEGWNQGRYRFNGAGELVVWDQTCKK